MPVPHQGQPVPVRRRLPDDGQLPMKKRKHMKAMWAWLILAGLTAAGGVRAERPATGDRAPAPVLRTGSGDGYKFLSALYHAGPARPGDRRSAVVMLFIDQEDEASGTALSALMTVARRAHGHSGLRRKVRFYVVGTGAGAERGVLMEMLTRHQVVLPVDALLDPRGEARRAFGMDALPQMVAVSRTGVLTACLDAKKAGSPRSVAGAVVSAVKESGRTPAATRRNPMPRQLSPAENTSNASQPVRW